MNNELDNKCPYVLILETVLRYRATRFTMNQLGSIIDNLEVLLDQMENAPFDWRQQVRSAWGDLDIAYADALDTNQSELTEHHRDVAANALLELQKLLEVAIEKFCKP
jgi:hypothetical protein